MKYKPFALVSVATAEEDGLLKENKYYTVITKHNGAKTARYITVNKREPYAKDTYKASVFIATGAEYNELDVVSVFVEIKGQSGAVIFWPEDSVRTQEEAYKMHDAITRWSRGEATLFESKTCSDKVPAKHASCDWAPSPGQAVTVRATLNGAGDIRVISIEPKEPKLGYVLGDFLCVAHVHDERCLVPLADVRKELDELANQLIMHGRGELVIALCREFGAGHYCSVFALTDRQLYRFGVRLAAMTKCFPNRIELPSWLA